MNTLTRRRVMLDTECCLLEDMTGEVKGQMFRIACMEVGAVLLFCLAIAII